MPRALIVHPDGRTAVVDRTWTLAQLQHAVGGLIQLVPHVRDEQHPLAGTWVGFVNEEGALDSLPVNDPATGLARAAGALLDPAWALRGPLVVLGPENTDDELTDVPDEVLDLAERVIT